MYDNRCDVYLDRLLERIKMDKGIPPGISFDEFKVFCQFLNNLEDFTIAMRMYTLADHPISKGKITNYQMLQCVGKIKCYGHSTGTVLFVHLK